MNNRKLQVCLQSRHIGARGGLEKWSREIAEGFLKRGAEVHLLSVDPITHPHLQGVSLPSSKLFSHRRMQAFDASCIKWQKSHPMDIVFGMDRTSEQTHIRAGNGVHAAYLEKRKNIEGYSSLQVALNPLNKTILDIEKRAFENPQLKVLFTNSYMVKNEILSHYAVPEDRIEVVHNGANTKRDDFETWVEKKPLEAKRLGLDPATFHLLFVGNGYERKGLSFLLKGMALLNRKDLHLSVVGKDRKISHFRHLTQKLGLEKHVSFFGPQSELRPFYQVADALAIPSIYDPFANVTVEALGMGLFVLSSKHNGGKEVLKEENGVVIEDLRSPEAMKASLEAVLRHPKTWVRSQEIRKSVNHLDFSSQLETLIEISIQRA